MLKREVILVAERSLNLNNSHDLKRKLAAELPLTLIIES